MTDDISKKPKFFAFAQSEDDRREIKSFAEANGFSETCVMQGDISTAADYFKNHASPVLLLVEVPSAEAAPALLDSLANVCDPYTKVIVIGSVNEYSFYRWLVDIGVFSYLLRPLNKEMLENTYKKSVEKVETATVSTREPTKIISIIGARGGVGASTIALNLSGIFAEHSGKKIALVDIDPQQGTLSLMLDIEPSRGLRDALDKPERIDQLFIDRVMSKPRENLWVLSAEESLSEIIKGSEATASALLKELSNKYDIVVIDVPRNLDGFARECLRMSNHVILVADLSLLSLRDTLRIHDLLVEGFKKPAPLVVANRVGMSSKSEMSLTDFEKGITTKVTEKVIYAPELFSYIGSDIPVVSNPRHPAVASLNALAKIFLPNILGAEKPKEKGLFASLSKKK